MVASGSTLAPSSSNRLAAEAALHARHRSLMTMVTVAVVIGAAATWYGFLDEVKEMHPTLSIGGAMAIASVGTLLPVLGRPITVPNRRWGGRDHSALLETHPLLLALAWWSIGAALIHFAVIKQHFNEFSLYGWFFIAIGVGQLLWAVLVVATPWRWLLVAGAVGNALIVVAYIVTRSYGSLVGPDATTPAEVGFGDLVSTAFQVVIVVGCVVLLRSSRVLRPWPSYASEVASVVVALGITALTVLALYSAVGGEPFVSHVG